MKNEKIQRFTPVEVLYHLVQGLFYLFLFITGTILLLDRLFLLNWFDQTTLANTHKKTGIIFVAFLTQVLILTIFSNPFRTLWRNIGQALKLKGEDILWLIKMPLHVVFPKIQVPHSDRFNPGQKMHLLTVFFVIIGMSISGIGMILIPGALIFWFIHILCFIAAALFLMLHIFLSMINPPTNKSITGMITGFVSMDYAREHHSRWVNEENPPHARHISLVAVIIFSLILASIAALAVYRYQPQRFIDRSKELIAHRGSDAIKPAMLIASHENDPEASKCFNCHSATTPPTNNKCITCHETIQNRIANQTGYHGSFTEDCYTCHKEHQGLNADIRPLEKATFNHQQAQFTLTGKHLELPCEKCHANSKDNQISNHIQFIGLAHKSCLSCHETPHPDITETNCLSCHTMTSWESDHLIFNHNRDSEFTLQGKHATLKCNKCHLRVTEFGEKTQTFKEIDHSCNSCHEDPHNNQFDQNCTTCHSEQGWHKPLLTEAHKPNARFPLIGQHAHVTCINCHKTEKGKSLANAQFSKLSMECASCHQDPHNSQFNKACNSCHTENGWKDKNLPNFHIPTSKFPLKGQHAKLNCEQCHSPVKPTAVLASAKFHGLSHECISCHKDPHEGQMSHSCSTCHTENGWEGNNLLFVHNTHSSYKLDAKHNKQDCSTCHNKTDKTSSTQFKGLPNTCETCHSDITNYMAGKYQSHTYAPDPHFNRVSCTDCHNPDTSHDKPEDYAQKCVNCHNEHYHDLFYNWSRSINSSTQSKPNQPIYFHNICLTQSLLKQR